MSITNLDNLKSFLNSLGISPKKSLSQNFLINQNTVDKIIDFISPKSWDSIVEIGPGPGALTESLCTYEANLTVIEKDDIFSKELSRFPSVQVLHKDVLDVSFSSLVADGSSSCMVGNLPYHITNPILEKFLLEASSFSRGVFMVQDEVAKRICAKPGSKDYGSLSVFISYFSSPSYAFKVEKNVFFPEPKVSSAIIVLERINPSPDYEEAFFEFVRLAFRQRRKMLRATLRQRFEKEAIQKACEKTNIAETARPESLSVEDFLALFKELKLSVE
jgi:16S rRNA (adenine1518-N6/adenine1519-N6)-dimethyltransferase